MKRMLIKNKIPHEFFIAQGKGESDNTIHAGSYHLALKEAGIEKCNIMTYSSILPKESVLINKPYELVHGSVMDTIMSVEHGTKREYIAVGIIYGYLYDKDNNKIGGIVCEDKSKNSMVELETKLKNAIQEIYENGFQDYELRDVNLIKQDLVVKKNYGTAIVSLCFMNYFYDIIEETIPL